MRKIKHALYDILYINNELSLTRIQMTVLFLIGISGCVGIYTGHIPNTKDNTELTKIILGLAVTTKIADNGLTQIYGSVRGEMPGIKNSRGEIRDV